MLHEQNFIPAAGNTAITTDTPIIDTITPSYHINRTHRTPYTVIASRPESDDKAERIREAVTAAKLTGMSQVTF